jgi:hypothetical protein
MAQAMVTAGEIDAAAGYEPTRAGQQPSVRPGRPITPRLNPWRMQTREVKGHLSLRSRSRCRWGARAISCQSPIRDRQWWTATPRQHPAFNPTVHPAVIAHDSGSKRKPERIPRRHITPTHRRRMRCGDSNTGPASLRDRTAGSGPGRSCTGWRGTHMTGIPIRWVRERRGSTRADHECRDRDRRRTFLLGHVRPPSC